MTRLFSSIVSAGLIFVALATFRGFGPPVRAQPFMVELKDQDELQIFTGTIAGI